jgi:hypothetical protein
VVEVAVVVAKAATDDKDEVVEVMPGIDTQPKVAEAAAAATSAVPAVSAAAAVALSTAAAVASSSSPGLFLSAAEGALQANPVADAASVWLFTLLPLLKFGGAFVCCCD